MNHENLLASIAALWVGLIFMWVWNFCLHYRLKKLEDVNEVQDDE